MNYRLVVKEDNYPGESGICSLLGIYPTIEEANFIASIFESRNKLKRNSMLVIDPVEPDIFPATTYSVANFLEKGN